MYIFITLVFMTVPRHQHLGAFIDVRKDAQDHTFKNSKDAATSKTSEFLKV